MEKIYSEEDLTKLILKASRFSHKHEIEGVVMGVLNINQKHPLFDTIVEKLCNRFGIETDVSEQDCIELLADFLIKLNGRYLHPLYKDTDDVEENINSFAIDLYAFYKKRAYLKLDNIKDIAFNNNFVIQLKSASPIIKILNQI